MIELRALGTAEIQTGSATITPSQEIVFAVALYIVQERGKRVSRSGLAALIWPDSPDRSRAHCFRQTLLQLKKQGFRVQADRQTVHLRRDNVRSDADAIAESVAAKLLEGQSLEFLHVARAIVRHHHERFDGRGYPDRLSGEDIPPAARIFTLADVYDSLGTRPLQRRGGSCQSGSGRYARIQAKGRFHTGPLHLRAWRSRT